NPGGSIVVHAMVRQCCRDGAGHLVSQPAPSSIAGKASWRDHSDSAIVQEQGAEVEEVGTEESEVGEQNAVVDGQRCGSGVEDAAAVGAGGVAGKAALLDRGRAEVVDAAARVAGDVASEGAVTHHQSPGDEVVDAGSISGGVLAV